MIFFQCRLKWIAHASFFLCIPLRIFSPMTAHLLFCFWSAPCRRITARCRGSTRVESSIALLPRGEAAGLRGLLHQRQHLLEAFSDASYNIEPDLHLSSCNFGVCGCSGRDVTKELQAGVRLQGSHMMAGITGVWLTTVSATAEKKKLKCHINLSVLWERTIGIWIRDQSRCLVLCKRSNFPGD